MDELFEHVVKCFADAAPLEETAVPPELARTRYPLGALELSCRNWRSARLGKVYAMRMKVKIPWLDILGMAFYPDPAFELPFFIFDLSCTKKKIISYVNVLAPADDAAYHERLIAPFAAIRQRYNDFHPFKMPAWMESYRGAATLYADPEPGRLDELKACVREYVAQYIRMVAAAEEIADPARRSATARFNETFKNDLVTKDRSQVMLAKVIGREKAGRIFREVLV